MAVLSWDWSTALLELEQTYRLELFKMDVYTIRNSIFYDNQCCTLKWPVITDSLNKLNVSSNYIHKIFIYIFKNINIWTYVVCNIKLRHLQYGTAHTPSVITVTSLKQSCLKYSCPTFSHYLPPNSIRCPLLCCLILLCCICSMRDCFICGWPNFQVWSRRSAETV